MIAIFRKYFIAFFFVICAGGVNGQSIFVRDTIQIPSDYKPEFRRQIHHEYIDRERKGILSSDGKSDKSFTPVSKDEINYLLTKELTERIPLLQYQIETDKELDHRLKVNYLKGLENILKYFRANWQSKLNAKKVDPVDLPHILSAYEACIIKDLEGKSIEPIIAKLSFGAATTLLNSNIFEKNPGYKTAKDLPILKYCLLYPSQTFFTLKENPHVPFADSLIRLMARKFPDQLYDYAAADNRLGVIIRNISDDVFISSVAKMARSKNGRLYFPLLDNIVKGKISFNDIDRVKDDSIAYYKLLVKTQIDYSERAMNKDTAYGFSELSRMIKKKAIEVFVNVINGLHDLSDLNVRFRIIQPLNAEELYYVTVSSDGIIYTSSFVKGVYPLMMRKVNQRADSLLLLVNFDKYRKFIKMAAGYNTLGHFLSSFPKQEDAVNLMKAFVGGLEKRGGLEDGVDVADSYASIVETNKSLADDMLNNVRRNYEKNVAQNNKKGIVMYNLLYKLFLSADSTQKIDLSTEFGIPPVYEVPYQALQNESGKVIIQVFIYGDRDGIGVFPSLLNMFSNANWKIDKTNPQWITITAIKGKPVSIYLNRPLPEENDEDAKAQSALCEYLEKNKYYPTITINRGHSYNAPYTIKQMFPSSKIVFMGSCGGYNMIHDILERAPDAHIIGTKQIADAPVNNPFFKLIAETLRNGSSVEWIPFWKELDKMVTNKIFEDYVPPYKNLGAIFIKAYTRAMGDEDEENQ